MDAARAAAARRSSGREPPSPKSESIASAAAPASQPFYHLAPRGSEPRTSSRRPPSTRRGRRRWCGTISLVMCSPRPMPLCCPPSAPSDRTARTRAGSSSAGMPTPRLRTSRCACSPSPATTSSTLVSAGGIQRIRQQVRQHLLERARPSGPRLAPAALSSTRAAPPPRRCFARSARPDPVSTRSERQPVGRSSRTRRSAAPTSRRQPRRSADRIGRAESSPLGSSIAAAISSSTSEARGARSAVTGDRSSCEAMRKKRSAAASRSSASLTRQRSSASDDTCASVSSASTSSDVPAVLAREPDDEQARRRPAVVQRQQRDRAIAAHPRRRGDVRIGGRARHVVEEQRFAFGERAIDERIIRRQELRSMRVVSDGG